MVMKKSKSDNFLWVVEKDGQFLKTPGFWSGSQYFPAVFTSLEESFPISNKLLVKEWAQQYKGVVRRILDTYYVDRRIIE